ncbi:putative UDP-rhamnose:rhamnosyltransferase 1 [Acorus calamus]|uniref:UDP-rhamnose:rhamnosyltransferase 1 n=1 Tax=Acorus calamus TaxID=4465 RepID=A0AAV9CUX9_ACOCL|nr:putative UDP-rhamnose:rhamnosyltransferase 1 [Acorus calamus]
MKEAFSRPQRRRTQTREDDPKIFEWLDKQLPKSVVYVAFRSEARPSGEQAHEHARGLEASVLSFFWVAKDVSLPSGLEERIKGRGLVHKGWDPQMKILAHEVIRGFLTHSGWSSVIEAMQFGLPLVLFPDDGRSKHQRAGVQGERCQRGGAKGRVGRVRDERWHRKDVEVGDGGGGRAGH